MHNLFRSGTVFFIIAGISFLMAAITSVRYWVTGDASAATSGGLVANGVVMFVIGLAIRSKNTK